MTGLEKHIGEKVDMTDGTKRIGTGVLEKVGVDPTEWDEVQQETNGSTIPSTVNGHPVGYVLWLPSSGPIARQENLDGGVCLVRVCNDMYLAPSTAIIPRLG